jgi:hypothetical protein
VLVKRSGWPDYDESSKSRRVKRKAAIAGGSALMNDLD